MLGTPDCEKLPATSKIAVDFRFIFVYDEYGFDESGVGKTSSWIKQLPKGGNPKTASNRCSLWAPV